MRSASDEVTPGYAAVGRLLGVRGIRGELKLEPLAPESILSPGRVVTVHGQERQIEHSRFSGRLTYVKLSGIDTREAARALHGAYLQVRERDLDALPEGEYYRFQLIGLAVRTLDGRELGRITDVLSAPENDVYVVSGPAGEVLIPAVDDVVRNVDMENRLITIEIIPGLLS